MDIAKLVQYNAQNNPRINDKLTKLGKKLDVNALFSEQVDKYNKENSS